MNKNIIISALVLFFFFNASMCMFQPVNRSLEKICNKLELLQEYDNKLGRRRARFSKEETIPQSHDRVMFANQSVARGIAQLQGVDPDIQAAIADIQARYITINNTLNNN